MVADFAGDLEKFALDPGGIEVFDLHQTRHFFVHARRGEHHMGADFANIFLGGFRLFRKVDRVTDLQAAGNGHHLLADPGKRQIGDIVIRVLAGVDSHQVLPHGQHVVV